MARYFQQQDDLSQRPLTDDFAPEEDEPVEVLRDEDLEQPLPEELYPVDDDLTDEEREELRRGRWRVLANLGDFIGVIAGAVVILLLVALLISLVNWVSSDISHSFTLWQTRM